MRKTNLEQFLTVSLHTITFDVHITFTYQKMFNVSYYSQLPNKYNAWGFDIF